MPDIDALIALLIPVAVLPFLIVYGVYGFLRADRLAMRLGAPTKAGEILMRIVHGAAAAVGLAFLGLLLYNLVPWIRSE